MFNKATGAITPADFDRAADGDELWLDVTDQYAAAFKEIAKEPFIYRLGYGTMVASVKKRQIAMASMDGLLEGFKHMSGNGDVSKEFYEKAVNMEAQFREAKNISFWNEKKYPIQGGADDTEQN